MTKLTKWHVHLAKTQISLGIHPVWSESLLSAEKAWVLSYPLSTQQRLIRQGGCPGWSESLLGTHAMWWQRWSTCMLCKRKPRCWDFFLFFCPSLPCNSKGNLYIKKLVHHTSNSYGRGMWALLSICYILFSMTRVTIAMNTLTLYGSSCNFNII